MTTFKPKFDVTDFYMHNDRILCIAAYENWIATAQQGLVYIWNYENSSNIYCINDFQNDITSINILEYKESLYVFLLTKSE